MTEKEICSQFDKTMPVAKHIAVSLKGSMGRRSESKSSTSEGKGCGNDAGFLNLHFFAPGLYTSDSY